MNDDRKVSARDLVDISVHSHELVDPKLTKEESKRIAEVARFAPLNTVNQTGDKIKVYLFCITGGPCAGKTTSMQYLAEKFSPKFKVYTLPEVATMTVQTGVNIIPSEFTPDTHTAFTKGIMKMQMDLEDYIFNIAKNGKQDSIVFADRGMIDNLAYCTPEVKERVLKETGWTLEKISNQRYDACFHLVTAADGAEEFYTLENNVARSEGPELARMLDKWTQNAWVCHNNHFIIDNNQKGFNMKMAKTYGLVANFLGLPEQVIYQKKFLVNNFNVESWPKDCTYNQFKEEIVFLTETDPSSKSSWVKKRTDLGGNRSYSKVERFLTKRHEERLELKQKITGKMYFDYRWQRDQKLGILNKDFTVLISNNSNFVFESYVLPDTGKTVTVVRIDGLLPDQKLENFDIPTFLELGEDITEQQKYFSEHVAANAQEQNELERKKTIDEKD